MKALFFFLLSLFYFQVIKTIINGYAFDDELRDAFGITNSGDNLLFFGITAQGPDKRILELSPMNFTIIKE